MINILKNTNELSVNIIYFLIVVLPIALVSGPFLPDLSISIITIIFLYKSYKKKLIFYYTNKYSKFFGIFFVILLFTSFLSTDPFISFKKTIFFLDFGFLL